MISCRLFIAVITLCLTAAGQSRQVVAISHRGEHLHHPENTLAAFQEAARAGADFIEVDVRTTSDGRLILSHDDTVDRCTNGQGKVASMTFAQLRRLDAGIKAGVQFKGVRIPEFRQALIFARAHRVGLYVDVKQASAPDLVREIDRAGMTDRVVIYCDLRLCLQIQHLNPALKLMPEADSVEQATRLVRELQPKVMAFDAGDFTAPIIAIAKGAGSQIYVDRLGPADNPTSWQAAIDAGADGIQTDHPAELVQYLRAKGFR